MYWCLWHLSTDLTFFRLKLNVFLFIWITTLLSYVWIKKLFLRMNKSWISNKKKYGRKRSSHKFVRKRTNHEFVRKRSSHEFARKRSSHEFARKRSSQEFARKRSSHEFVRKRSSREFARKRSSLEFAKEEKHQNLQCHSIAVIVGI